MRAIRDDHWNHLYNLDRDSWYYIANDLSDISLWPTTTVPSILPEDFNLRFQALDVNRNGEDDIVTSGGSIDISTLHFVIEVIWETQATTTSRRVDTYLTNFFGDE